MKLTDDMTTGALGFGPEQLVGKRIVATHAIDDSDREESLLVCEDGTCVLLSCDPVRHDDAGVPLPPDQSSKRWEVVLYDATSTKAGVAALGERREPST
jgi:hypothetical protein